MTDEATPFVARGLAKRFGSKSVLQDINLKIEPGTVLGLLGANGSGKTTLIKCALGLLKPTAGTVTIYGEDAWDLSADVKARIGYVPQEVTTYPWMRVRHVISYTAAFYPNWNHDLAADLCRQWKLPLEDRAGILSVGQMQTLGIVLALGHEPDLLVLDEPVASLDPSARREFLRTLIDLVQDPKRAVIFSTHITSDLERVANRLAIIKDTAIEFSGELDELKERVKRIRVLGAVDLPSTFAVADALHCDLEGRLATLTVDNFTPAMVEELRQTWDAEVTVTDLNLEEIFVAMHGGDTSSDDRFKLTEHAGSQS